MDSSVEDRHLSWRSTAVKRHAIKIGNQLLLSFITVDSKYSPNTHLQVVKIDVGKPQNTSLTEFLKNDILNPFEQPKLR